MDLVALGGALGGGGYAFYALQKITGPSLEAVGAALERWTVQRLKNVGRVVQNAGAKLGSRLEEPGAVPPRVMMRILEDGSWSDDDVVIEYLGGVLASSYSEGGRDDRGTSWAALVSHLSAPALRTHYMIYGSLRRLLVGDDRNLSIGRFRIDSVIRVPLLEVLEFVSPHDEHTMADSHVKHGLLALDRTGLVEHHDLGVHGEDPSLGDRSVEGPMTFWATPSAAGIELFNWAHGKGDAQLDSLLDPDESYDLATAELALPSGASIRGSG